MRGKGEEGVEQITVGEERNGKAWRGGECVLGAGLWAQQTEIIKESAEGMHHTQ